MAARASGSGLPVAPAALDVPEPPADLTDHERTLWARLAPAAALAGTLTPATACDFRILIELLAEADELLHARREAGWGDAGRALSSAYRATILRAEAKARAFCLAPMGKPMAGVRVEDQLEEDSFAEFDRPRAVAGRRTL